VHTQAERTPVDLRYANLHQLAQPGVKASSYNCIVRFLAQSRNLLVGGGGLFAEIDMRHFLNLPNDEAVCFRAL
jgi:hypothetical protein